MARLPLIEPSDASPAVQASYAEVEAMGYPIFNVMKMLAHNPGAFSGFIKMMQALYAQPRIPPRLRELAYLRASQINSCHY